jgi:hypothetical protein
MAQMEERFHQKSPANTPKDAIPQPEAQDTESRVKPQNTAAKKHQVYLIRPPASKPEQAEPNQVREQELIALSKSLATLQKYRDQYLKSSFLIFDIYNAQLDIDHVLNSPSAKRWNGEFPEGKDIHNIKLDSSEAVWLEAALKSHRERTPRDYNILHSP